MFVRDKVISSLNGLVGWKQPFNPDVPTLSVPNLATSSGYTFDENSFVKLEVVKATQDYPDISDSDFNTLLVSKQNTAITNVLNSIFSDSDYIDKQILYKYPNNKVNTEVLPSGFVGYEIEVGEEKNIAFEINRVLLEFQGTGDVKLLLFNSAKSDPIEEKTVSISSSFQSEELGWVVDNSDGYYKGKFYFGYLTSGLTVLPYKRDYENANVQSCITHLGTKNIEVSGHATETLFDLESIDNVAETWGLNPDITVYDDFTELIINNKRLFSKAIQIQGQVDILSGYLASIRSNRNEREMDDNINKILVELNGLDSDVKIIGLKSKLYGELGRIRKEIKRLRDGYFSHGFKIISRE